MHMKDIFKLVGIISALQISTFAQAGTTYNYNYLFDSGDIVSGSFTGTANGNLITNLSDITVSLDGNSFNTDASGSLYGFSYVTDINGNLVVLNTSGILDGKTAWINGDAAASFDGTENNFLFIDSNQPDSSSFTNFFAIGNAFGDYRSVVSAGILVNEPFNATNWTVTEATSTVPVPAAVWLFASALVGWIGVNKGRQQAES